MIKVPIEIRFRQKVKTGPGCWMWQAGKDKNGYGTFSLTHKRPIQAHRYSWILNNGPIPDGKLILHRCDTPGCVNPGHLFLGTHQDNADDMIKKGRYRNGNVKLTKEKVIKIRSEYSKGDVTLTCLGKRYGVTFGMIALIVRGKAWTSV